MLPKLDLEYLLKNSFWNGLRQSVTMISGLALSVALARLSPPELVGHYELVLSILAITALSSIPGLNTSIIKATADGYDASYPEAVKKSLLWSFLGLPLLFLIAGYYFWQNQTALATGLLAAGFVFPFFYAPNTWEAFLIGKERFDLTAKFSLLQSPLNVLLTVSAILIAPQNLGLILTVYLLTLAITNWVYYFKARQFMENTQKDPEAISYGWFVTRLNLIGVIANHVDSLAIGFFLGPTSLAIYAIGTNFSRKILNAVKSFLAVATPRIAVKNTFSRANYVTAFIVSGLGTLVLFFLLPTLIDLLYSQKYAESILLSQLVIIFLPFYVLRLLFHNHVLFFLKDRAIARWEAILFPSIKLLLMVPLLYYFKTTGLAFLLGFQNVLGLLILLGVYLFVSKNRHTAGLVE